MNYQAADIEYAERLLSRVLQGVKETFDILASGVGRYTNICTTDSHGVNILTQFCIDYRKDNIRISDAVFLIHLADLVQNGAAPPDVQRDRMERIVMTINEPQVTLATVQADVAVGEYLTRWVTEFGDTIYFWDGFNIDITLDVPREVFDKIILYMHDHPQKQIDVRNAIEALRPENLEIPSSTGGKFKTPYRKLFVIPDNPPTM